MKFKNSNGQWQNIKFKNYGIEQTPIGSMIYYPSQNIPAGYLVCDGREVLIADYPLLFNAIGYIGGSNVNTGYFRLPDMQGIVPAGYCAEINSYSPLAGAFGDTVGDSTHTLTVDEMPMHNHHGLYDDSLQNQRVGAWGTGTEHKGLINEMGSNEYEAFATGFAGGSQPHSIVQPTKLYHWLIKAKNVITLGGYTEDFEVNGTLNVNGTDINKKIEGIIIYNNPSNNNTTGVNFNQTIDLTKIKRLKIYYKNTINNGVAIKEIPIELGTKFNLDEMIVRDGEYSYNATTEYNVTNASITAIRHMNFNRSYQTAVISGETNTNYFLICKVIAFEY